MVQSRLRESGAFDVKKKTDWKWALCVKVFFVISNQNVVLNTWRTAKQVLLRGL